MSNFTFSSRLMRGLPHLGFICGSKDGMLLLTIIAMPLFLSFKKRKEREEKYHFMLAKLREVIQA